MFKLSSTVNIIFLVILCILGNYFVKALGQIFLYALLTYNVLYFIRYTKLRGIFMPGLRLSLGLFIAISILYVVFSYFNMIAVFDIHAFQFRPQYIFRQAYSLPFFFFVVCNITYDMVRQNGQFSMLTKYPMIIYMAVVFASALVGGVMIINVVSDDSAVPTINDATQLIVESLCLFICYFERKKINILLAIFVLIIWDVFFAHKFTGALIALLFIFYYFKKSVSGYVKAYAIGALLLLTFMIVANTQITAFLYAFDPDSWWRFVYWTHEFNILAQTHFLGVGYGTPYARNDIFRLIEEFQLAGEHELKNMHVEDMVYLVGQHNSFVNMFYRLGLLGGFIFCYVNYTILLYSSRLIKVLKYLNKSLELRFLMWLEFTYIGSVIIILFNVGIESPRYFIPYLVSVSALIGIVSKYYFYYVKTFNRTTINQQPSNLTPETLQKSA